jgi:hypothetical protein
MYAPAVHQRVLWTDKFTNLQIVGFGLTDGATQTRKVVDS